MMRWCAIVVAAGRGVRFGRPKQLVPLGDLPLAVWAVRTFVQMSEIERVVVVTEAQWLTEMGDALSSARLGRRVPVVAGGSTRQESVRAGLAAAGTCDAVLVHDGARPLVRASDVRAVMAEVRAGRGALLARPSVDTVKLVDPATRLVRETLDREYVWLAQTPQAATCNDFARAHAKALEDGVAATDDAALLERIGVEIVAVPSSNDNFKITTPDDLARASALREVADASGRRPG
jgi:2-C-methyl-D-erythritol 4-phosphate cytidylyltransferase